MCIFCSKSDYFPIRHHYKKLDFFVSFDEYSKCVSMKSWESRNRKQNVQTLTWLVGFSSLLTCDKTRYVFQNGISKDQSLQLFLDEIC